MYKSLNKIPSFTGYYTPPSAGANNSKKSSPESSQRTSVSSESEEPSDSEDQISAPSLTSSENNGNVNEIRNHAATNKAFYIANELMTSERVYVDVLRLLNVEFRDFLQKARRDSKNGLMPDSDYSRLFNNLPELQTLNEVRAQKGLQVSLSLPRVQDQPRLRKGNI